MSEVESINPSMRAAIAELTEGESFARCERLALERITRDRITKRIADMRNTVSAAMRRAARDTGNEYAVETGAFLTTSRDLMLVAVVTRRQ